jgi:hypothetical protein
MEVGAMPVDDPLREINLAEPASLLFDKDFAQRVMSWRIEGASHPPVLDRLFAYGKFAYLEKRAACNFAAQFRPRSCPADVPGKTKRVRAKV